jgi:hypothetical protein
MLKILLVMPKIQLLGLPVQVDDDVDIVQHQLLTKQAKIWIYF